MTSRTAPNASARAGKTIPLSGVEVWATAASGMMLPIRVFLHCAILYSAVLYYLSYFCLSKLRGGVARVAWLARENILPCDPET